MRPLQIQAFKEHGAVLLKGVFLPWISLLERGVASHRANPSPLAELHRDTTGSARCFFDDYCHYDHRILEIDRLVEESPAAALAGQLMQSRHVYFYHAHTLVKDAGVTKPTPWHHDQPYYPFDGSQNCSLWIPLDPIPRSSTLRFLRGSHRGPWYIPRKFATLQNYPVDFPLPTLSSFPKQLEASPLELPAEPDQFLDMPTELVESSSDVLEWPVEPGDAVAFHFRTLHAAGGNLSLELPRRVVALRFLGDDARRCSVPRPWKPGPPITGGLRPGQLVSEAYTARSLGEDRDFPFPRVWSAN
eukprot:gb/GEZN01014170.1/.p1 GENE.gb/GEZN01014170.1/~~gb/GEZN01014170.1/.p1  ORF type:complete len:302 (-),score=10.63 gb/GEZN01014170.1/:4-909(-)